MKRRSLASLGMTGGLVAALSAPLTAQVPGLSGTLVVTNKQPSTATVIDVGTTRVERWIYQRGQGQFDAAFTFEDGKLVDIELLVNP